MKRRLKVRDSLPQYYPKENDMKPYAHDHDDDDNVDNDSVGWFSEKDYK